MTVIAVDEARPAPAGADTFWAQRLAGAARLDVYPDHPRPAGWPYTAEPGEHRLSGTVASAVRAFAREHAVSERAVLLGGLVAVLHRYSGADDVVLGAPQPGTAYGVLRVPAAGATLAQVAQRSQVALDDLATHGPVPPEVVATLAAGNPVPCPVSIAFPATAPAHPAATVGEDLAIEVVPDGDGFRLCVRYAAELFGPRRIGALLHHWERVVHAIVSAPDRAVAQAPLLDDGERAALLALGTGPDRPYPQTTLHSLVAQRMCDTPDALAGICAGERLTYGELDRRSALLAARLRQAGAGPGSVVAVVLGRSLHTLVAMLGVLRAGAAYTPIDPQFPAQRIRFVLDDTAAPVVLTLDGLLGDCRPPEGVTVLRLDTDWPAIEDATRDAAPVPDQAGPESLAYVLFTSGSTGTPKGVLLEHGMIVNYLTWMVEECRIDAGTRMLHACSPVFDLAVGEIFAALTSGACVVVATHDEVVSPGELTRVIAQGRVTHSFTPPTTLGLVDPAACADLRCVLVAGEVVAPELVERWLDRGARVMNLYGPAEAAVSCTFFDCVPGTFGSSIPIGVVMPNRAVRVLDPAGEPVPVGVPGELVVAGVGVARGYLNRPELTAQRFGSDPFGAGTAYRTGDLARWNAAGQLEFLGRLDTQVKLNGLRIELGEIEAVLATHPDVGAAVVAVRADRGPARLVGYVVARDGRRPDPVELREHAARVLPPYMVPAAFVTVAAFPLGATGKVNRAALPAPGAGRPPLRTPYRAPETPGQARVTAMIEAVLGIDGVGVDDRVFELGASSLDVARLCVRLAEVRGAAVPVSQVYRLPTAAQLAEWLETAPAPQPPAAPPQGSGGTVALPPGQANLVEVPDLMVCPTTFWIDGDLDVAALRAAAGDLHRRHQALHARYLATTPATAELPGDPGEPEVHVLPAAAGDQDALAALDGVAQQPLDIAAGRVWRAVLVPVRDRDRHLFCVAIHHIGFDGWSQAIVVEDLALAYAARVRGEAPRWPEPAPGLAEVAAETARYLAGVDTVPQQVYWLNQLRTLPGLRLPGAAGGPLAPWGPKDGRLFPIAAERVREWDAYARTAGMTRFAYLVAVFGHVLRTLGGRPDVGMMVPVARRGNPLLDRAVGCRLDAVCLRVRPPAGSRQKPVDWLAQAAETVHAAMAAQDLPFAAVVAALTAVRPDLHVLLTIPTFVLQDYARPGLPLPGCRTELVEDGYAKEVPTPLTVEVFPAGDGFTLRITVRTDRVPVELADRIGELFLQTLAAGPDALAGGAG